MKNIRNFFRWQDMPISRKYLMVFFLSVILFTTSGILVHQQGLRTEGSMNDYVEQRETVQHLNELALLMHYKELQIADFIISKDQVHVENFERAAEETRELFVKIQNELDLQNQDRFNEIIEKNNRFDLIFKDTVLDVELELSDDYLATKRKDSTNLRTNMLNEIDMLIQEIEEEQNKQLTHSQSNMRVSLSLLWIGNISAVIIGIIVLLLVSRNISRNLGTVVHVLDEMAEGNFGVESVEMKGKNEIAQIAHSVNDMKDKFRATLMNFDRASNQVRDSSDELFTSANEVQQSAEQVAITMSELATGAESQANSTADLLSNMQNFMDIVNTSAKESEEMAKESDEVLTITHEGSELMHRSVEQIKHIDAIVAKAVEQVKGLDHQSAQISNLVNVVKDIAEQTNLLALNAAIEAARAGEYGAGFSVVADEVRNLAEQVTESVSEITTIVHEIQTETRQVVQALNSGYVEVQQGAVQIERTGNNFEAINEAISNMAKRIDSISKNMESIVVNSDNMNTLIEDISAVSEESAANVEEAAATTEETSSVMDEVAKNSEELSKLADELHEQISSFKL